MSEASGAPASQEAASAGAMLRQARQAQGLHIAALAASIKVAPRKLEALEADRYDELPDATFTRALAQAVCRALKIDAAPVLARLPSSAGLPLDKVHPGLNATVRSHGGRRDPGDASVIPRPLLWAAALLMLGAVVVYLLPEDWLPQGWFATAPAPAPAPFASAPLTTADPMEAVSPSAPAASTPASAAAVQVGQPPAAQPAASAASAAAAVPAAGGNALHIVTTGPSWIEVVDGQGKVLLWRTVQAGEPVLLDGAVPLKVKVGNAAATRLSFRGQPVPFTTKDNVVRLELK